MDARLGFFFNPLIPMCVSVLLAALQEKVFFCMPECLMCYRNEEMVLYKKKNKAVLQADMLYVCTCRRQPSHIPLQTRWY